MSKRRAFGALSQSDANAAALKPSLQPPFKKQFMQPALTGRTVITEASSRQDKAKSNDGASQASSKGSKTSSMNSSKAAASTSTAGTAAATKSVKPPQKKRIKPTVFSQSLELLHFGSFREKTQEEEFMEAETPVLSNTTTTVKTEPATRDAKKPPPEHPQQAVRNKHAAARAHAAEEKLRNELKQAFLKKKEPDTPPTPAGSSSISSNKSSKDKKRFESRGMQRLQNKVRAERKEQAKQEFKAKRKLARQSFWSQGIRHAKEQETKLQQGKRKRVADDSSETSSLASSKDLRKDKDMPAVLESIFHSPEHESSSDDGSSGAQSKVATTTTSQGVPPKNMQATSAVQKSKNHDDSAQSAKTNVTMNLYRPSNSDETIVRLPKKTGAVSLGGLKAQVDKTTAAAGKHLVALHAAPPRVHDSTNSRELQSIPLIPPTDDHGTSTLDDSPTSQLDKKSSTTTLATRRASVLAEDYLSPWESQSPVNKSAKSAVTDTAEPVQFNQTVPASPPDGKDDAKSVDERVQRKSGEPGEDNHDCNESTSISLVNTSIGRTTSMTSAASSIMTPSGYQPSDGSEVKAAEGLLLMFNTPAAYSKSNSKLPGRRRAEPTDEDFSTSNEQSEKTTPKTDVATPHLLMQDGAQDHIERNSSEPSPFTIPLTKRTGDQMMLSNRQVSTADNHAPVAGPIKSSDRRGTAATAVAFTIDSPLRSRTKPFEIPKGSADIGAMKSDGDDETVDSSLTIKMITEKDLQRYRETPAENPAILNLMLRSETMPWGIRQSSTDTFIGLELEFHEARSCDDSDLSVNSYDEQAYESENEIRPLASRPLLPDDYQTPMVPLAAFDKNVPTSSPAKSVRSTIEQELKVMLVDELPPQEAKAPYQLPKATSSSSNYQEESIGNATHLTSEDYETPKVFITAFDESASAASRVHSVKQTTHGKPEAVRSQGLTFSEASSAKVLPDPSSAQGSPAAPVADENAAEKTNEQDDPVQLGTAKQESEDAVENAPSSQRMELASEDDHEHLEEWTAAYAGFRGVLPIFQLANGKWFKHARLPPGWRLGVSRTKNRPFYSHPDYGRSYYPPVCLPLQNDDDEKLVVPFGFHPKPDATTSPVTASCSRRSGSPSTDSSATPDSASRGGSSGTSSTESLSDASGDKSPSSNITATALDSPQSQASVKSSFCNESARLMNQSTAKKAEVHIVASPDDSKDTSCLTPVSTPREIQGNQEAVRLLASQKKLHNHSGVLNGSDLSHITSGPIFNNQSASSIKLAQRVKSTIASELPETMLFSRGGMKAADQLIRSGKPSSHFASTMPRSNISPARVHSQFKAPSNDTKDLLIYQDHDDSVNDKQTATDSAKFDSHHFEFGSEVSDGMEHGDGKVDPTQQDFSPFSELTDEHASPTGSKSSKPAINVLHGSRQLKQSQERRCDADSLQKASQEHQEFADKDDDFPANNEDDDFPTNPDDASPDGWSPLSPEEEHIKTRLGEGYVAADEDENDLSLVPGILGGEPTARSSSKKPSPVIRFTPRDSLNNKSWSFHDQHIGMLGPSSEMKGADSSEDDISTLGEDGASVIGGFGGDDGHSFSSKLSYNNSQSRQGSSGAFSRMSHRVRFPPMPVDCLQRLDDLFAKAKLLSEQKKKEKKLKNAQKKGKNQTKNKAPLTTTKPKKATKKPRESNIPKVITTCQFS